MGKVKQEILPCNEHIAVLSTSPFEDLSGGVQYIECHLRKVSVMKPLCHI